MKITVLLATGREGRMSERVSSFITQVLTEHDYETQFVDIRSFESPRTVAKWAPDEISENWKQVIEDTDLLIIVSPEYNFMFPGELKILLDRLTTEYKNKPVILAGVSAGNFGGARAVEFLKLYVTSLGFSFKSALYYPTVEQEFSEEGSTTNPKHKERLLEAIQNLK